MKPFSVDIVQLREFELVFTQPVPIAEIHCKSIKLQLYHGASRKLLLGIFSL